MYTLYIIVCHSIFSYFNICQSVVYKEQVCSPITLITSVEVFLHIHIHTLQPMINAMFGNSMKSTRK